MSPKKSTSARSKSAAVRAKPSGKPGKSSSDATVRHSPDGEEIVIDPNYRQKLRPRGAVRVKEPLGDIYTELGHSNRRVRLLAKAEGLKYMSKRGVAVIADDATEMAHEILLVAASFASHQHRSMINENDVNNAFAMVTSTPVSRIYSFGSLKQAHSHKRSLKNCKIDITAAAKRRPHRQSFPVETKVKKTTQSPAKQAAKNKSRQ